jgi:hypothetical protein
MNYINELIDLAHDILSELERINAIIEPDEYEKDYANNLEKAYELLSETKDLIYG